MLAVVDRLNGAEEGPAAAATVALVGGVEVTVSSAPGSRVAAWKLRPRTAGSGRSIDGRCVRKC